MDAIYPTNYQRAVLSVPAEWNLLLAGGRGGGKSYGALLCLLRHVEQFKDRARPLVIRESHQALEELGDLLDEMLSAAYRGDVRRNRQDGTIRLPNGAKVELGQLSEPKSYRKFHGRSFSLLLVEEAGEIGDNRWVDMLRSNLRAARGVPLREIRTANPGGVSHAHIHKNFIARAPAWQPYEIDGSTWINCPSLYTDNPYIDGESYARRLRAACGGDEELLRAWLTGDWNISRGAFFASSWDERVHVLPRDWKAQLFPQWRSYIAMDWGSSAPAVVYVCARSPGVPGIPKDSLVLVDEIATHEPDDLNAGLKWPPSKLAEAIHAKCGEWMFYPNGCGDDAAGIDDSLLAFFQREYNITLQKPSKERVGGWTKMRQMMTNAKERNGRPGLYVTARCQYFLATVPFLPRDLRRPEDVASNGPDHAADAARYACMHEGFFATSGQARHEGMY